MKKLNLLEPNVITGFLNGGAGEKVRYLQILDTINLKALEADVEAGAIQFKECLDAAKKGMSRVVVVRATNEEEGLMAVNYLAGISNNSKNILFEDDTERYLWDSADEDILLEDEYILDLDYDDDEYDDFSDWEESPCKVPIVKYEEIERYSGNFSRMHQGEFIMAGRPNMRNHQPYWMKCNKEAVCVVVDFSKVMYGSCCSPQLPEVLERFQHNKHLYVLILDKAFEIDEESPFCSYDQGIEQTVFKYVLENTADVVVDKAKEKQL